MTNLRPVFVPPRPPNICVGCGDETRSLSLHRVCGRCETVCAACAPPTGCSAPTTATAAAPAPGGADAASCVLAPLEGIYRPHASLSLSESLLGVRTP